jgi:hypothetical protein
LNSKSILNIFRSTFLNKTAIYAVVAFVCLAGCCEVLLRNKSVQQIISTPYPVANYKAVDTILHQLDQYIIQYGQVDCILLGSSLVDVAVNPVVFGEAFQQQTGEEIHCFTMGISAGTASSFGPVAQILAKRYNPPMLILATSPRAFDGRDSSQYEHEFPKSDWAKYHQGQFNFRGWLLDKSYIYRILDNLAKITAEIRTSPEPEVVNPRPNKVSSRTVQGHGNLVVYFLEVAPIYTIREGQTYEQAKKETAFTLSEEDFAGFKQVVQLKEDGAFQLMVVEIPTPILYYEDRSEAPSPTAEEVFDGEIGAYSIEHNVPFWRTADLEMPFTHYSDASHMHISGNHAYSLWLGQQVGEAVKQGFGGDEIPESIITQPPLGDLRFKDDIYLATKGLGEDSFREYQDHKEVFDLVGNDALIINTQKSQLSPEFFQAIVGSFIKWSWTVDDSNRGDYYDLLVIMERMRTYGDPMLSSEEQLMLDSWAATQDPGVLKGLGIDYIFYTEVWAEPETAPSKLLLSHPDVYELIRMWDFVPLQESYYLYRVLN